MANENIQVEITDESAAHCLKIVLQNLELPPIEIFLHTVQAVDLVHKLSLAICELHHRDSERLIAAAQRYFRETVCDDS